MQGMRALRPWVALGIVAALMAGCSGESQRSLPEPSAAFCNAAQRYDTRLAQKPSLAEQIQLVGDMAHHAPKDIAGDAQAFLDALRRRADGDRSVVDNPKVQHAVENVNRRAANGCDFYHRDPGNGI